MIGVFKTVHFYVKLLLSVFLAAVILVNIIKTVKGVNKGEMTMTPATVTIYFSFLMASILAIALTIFNKVINDEFKTNPDADVKRMEIYDFFLLEFYQTFYWASQLAFLHKYIVTAFEMPQFFTLYQIKLEGQNMVGAA